VSDFKTTFSYPVPLYGVLTDFLPHSYWALENVDRYFVANPEAKEKLHEDGIPEDRITVSGIPIDPEFSKIDPTPAAPKPVILLMGGSEGLGSIEKNVLALDGTEGDFEIVVAAGKNERLSRRLDRLKKKTRKKLSVHPYLKDTVKLMSSASVLVSKPGGLTMSEALSLRLPIIFVDSLPGQESKNAAYLLRNRAALEARSSEELSLYVAQLLRMPAKIDLMKKNMARLAKPHAALEIARWIAARDLAA
ncbi:MAG: hypothetical protein HYZ86_02670, partial [Candidatus Omnitrophica bacterium]|nr:hypothetical protein [Candidatus Omnitrophota bacterium]